MVEEDHSISRDRMNRKINQYFIPFSKQIETVLIWCLGIVFTCLFLTQAFILTKEENQAMVNKAIRYEGVFREDPIEAKATLQRR
jgi:hypothetical protein